MAIAMEVLDNRRASFNKSKSKSKNAHKGWPHPKSFIASPDALAHAGFFFKPTKENIDNVECFLCNKELGGWDENDNPYEVHLQKCPKCPWAIARCSVEFDFYEDGQFYITDDSRLPQNKVLEKARLDTFIGKSRWPHDASRTHGVKSQKMAAAGFVYTPQREGDDTSTCFYCDLTLSGWDEDDDPIEEHEKRKFKTGIPCPFFEAKVVPAQTIKEPEPNKKVRKSNAPKKKADGEKDSAATINKTEGEITNAKPRPASRSKKSVKNEAKLIDIDEDEDTELREDDDPSLKVQPEVPSKPKVKKSIKKSTAAARVAVSTTQTVEEEHDGIDMADQSDTESAPRQRTRTQSGKNVSQKGSSKKKAKAPASPVDGKPASKYQDFEIGIVEENEPRKGRTKKASRARTLSRSKSKGRSIERQSTKPSSSDNESRPPSRASSKTKKSKMDINDDEVPEEVDNSQARLGPEPEGKAPPKLKTKANKPNPVGGKGKGKRMDVEDDDFGPAAAEAAIHERASSRPTDLDDVTNTVASHSSAAAAPHVPTSEGFAPTKSSRQNMVLNVKRSEQRPDASSRAQAKATAEEAERQPANDLMDIDGGLNEAEVNAIPETDDELIESRPASPSPKPSSKLPSERQDDALQTPKQAPAQTVHNTVTREPMSVTIKPVSLSHTGSRETSPSRSLHKAGGGDDSMERRTSSRRDSEKENRSKAAVVIPHLSQPKTGPPAPATPERQILRFVSPRPVSPSPSPQRPILSPLRSPSPVIAPSPIPTPEETRSPSPPFLPPLATVPRVHDRDLTTEERGLTVEQWIRREMEVECDLLRKDGERRIQMFQQRAEEVRKEIEAL